VSFFVAQSNSTFKIKINTMEKELKMNNELTARFHFRVPLSTRLEAEKRAEENGSTISDICRAIISNAFGQKMNNNLSVNE
jgi:hypothetical protein